VTDVFPDPREQFLAQDPRELRDPYQLTPDEEASVEAVRTGVSAVTVAAGLGAAYLVYRGYMSRQMKAKLAAAGNEVGPGPLMMAASAVWNAFVPKWVSMTAPYLVAGYLEGIREAKAGTVPVEYLEAIAEGYARDLGHHLNEVSKEGLLAGYQTLVNRKVPPIMAARRTADAYGITRRGMNTLVNVWTMVEDKRYTDQVLPSAKEDRAKAFMERQHQLRARQIGDNEEWAARTQAKQVVWMYGTNHGVIPSTARRVWITAADERVCEICGPMDGRSAPVGEKFKTSAGKVWTPPTHVNCRCDVVLDLTGGEDIGDEITALLEAEAVHKAAPGDPYDRDKMGRFSRSEGRRYKEREAEVDALLAQVNQALSGVSLQPRKLETPSLKAPSLSIKAPSLSGPSLKAVSLGETKRLPGVSLRQRLGAQLDRPRIQIGLGAELWKPQGIKLEPKKTAQGEWQVMDEVLTAMMSPYQLNPARYSTGELIFLDEDVAFFEEISRRPDGAREVEDVETLNTTIGKYWEGWVDDQMEDYFNQAAMNGGEMLYEDEEEHKMWFISPTDYQTICEDIINRTSVRDQEVLELTDPLEPEGTPYKVKTGVLAKYLRLDDKVREDMPALIQTHHGMPGVTEHLEGYQWANPGKWQVVNIREVETDDVGDYHHMPYRVLEVEPADLFDED
jgi:hypothetical protein